MNELLPQAHAQDARLGQTFCTYIQTTDEEGNIVLERRCGSCTFNQAGEGRLRTNKGTRARFTWTACPDQTVNNHEDNQTIAPVAAVRSQ